MNLLHGIEITLINFVDTGNKDVLNNPIYEPVETTVSNVLVAPSTSEDVVESLNLYGKKAVYTLGIPKGDTNVWTDCEVILFGERYRSIGYPKEGIEDLIPLDWHKKVMVERYG